MGPKNWRFDQTVIMIPWLRTFFGIWYTPGLHFPFWELPGWVTISYFLDRECFLWGWRGCLLKWCGWAQPSYKALLDTLKILLLPQCCSPLPYVRNARWAHRAQSLTLGAHLLPLSLSSSSPLSWHLKPISQLPWLTHSTNLLPVPLVNVIGPNLTSRSGKTWAGVPALQFISCATLSKVASETLSFFFCEVMVTVSLLQGLWYNQHRVWPIVDAYLSVGLKLRLFVIEV